MAPSYELLLKHYALRSYFKDNASDPIITVKSNKISLGRADLQSLLSPSGFFDKLWDFIAKVCGFNKTELDDDSTNKLSM